MTETLKNEQKYVQAMTRASEKIKTLLAEVESLKNRDPIAIIGMGCRFPGNAANPESFWKILERGTNTIREIPADRWNVDHYYDPDKKKPGKMYIKSGGFLDAVDEFDPEFFGISPVEAKHIDPQHRLLLETSWEALEYAGENIEKLKGSRTGVFIGISSSDYSMNHIASGEPSKIMANSLTGVTFSTASGRLSYLFDFQGPSVTVDTACSSSMVALHLAIRSLRDKESDMAIVGGVNLMLAPETCIALSKLKALSVDGLSKAFDETADGYGRGEGCGILILKRLSEAEKANNPILAVVKGSAVNHDGMSNGMTAPNAVTQQKVIQKALEQADISPDEVDYIEAHGTGTALGDPIEVNAIERIFGKRKSRSKLLIGSVKTNIGHLEAAAGISSVIKVVLSLQKGKIPSSLHFQTPSSRIPWDEISVNVAAKLMPWPENQGLRTAGVSSFGFSGTNAHIILQEYTSKPSNHSSERNEDIKDRPLHILSLSAKKKNALEMLARSYDDFLRRTSANVEDICYSTNTGRSSFKHRLALTGSSKEDFSKLLVDYLKGQESSRLFRSNDLIKVKPEIVFLFTGEGSPYPDMGRTLFNTQAVFRDAIMQCDKILQPYLEHSVIKFLYSNELQGQSTHQDQVVYDQSALFTLEYALFKLWASWGIKPSIVLGYNLGECVAACIAGILSLEDALKLAVLRSKLLQDSSFQTESVLEEFNKITLYKPELKIISSITGRQSDISQMSSLDYWAMHNRNTNDFCDTIRTLDENTSIIFLEIGPHPELTAIGKRCFAVDKGIWLHSLMRGENDWDQMLKNLACLYSYGIEPDWNGFDGPYKRNKIVSLPTYPFQKKRYWIDSNEMRFEKMSQREGQNVPLIQEGKKLERNHVLSDLKEMIVKISGIDGDDLDINENLLSIGFESIMLGQLRQMIENKFEIDIEIRQLFDDLSDLKSIANHIICQFPQKLLSANPFSPQRPTETPLPQSLPFAASCMLKTNRQKSMENIQENVSEGIMTQQIKLMSQQMDIISRQMDIIENKKNFPSTTINSPDNSPQSNVSAAKLSKALPTHSETEPSSFFSKQFYKKERLDILQKKYLHEFINRYTLRTKKSKHHAQKYRRVLSDIRSSMGFRQETKNIFYPIVSKSSKGDKFWDIDDNEYIDLAMGVGVHLFGYQPPFIIKAIEEQLKQGMQIGSQSELAGQVSELICELTGMERVTFCNTGTEAVMTAIRLTRAVTGKDKIVMFLNSYHGHSDGTLINSKIANGTFQSIPMFPGVPKQTASNVLVLPYGDSGSLETIRRYAHELASVLVEPIQSRRPDLHPETFLKQLRQLTIEINVPLIFDEVITGFRVHPGGYQAYSNIKADLATYGKILGGGLPIGVVAGSATYLDKIDGGVWCYDNDSFPKGETTFAAGTFRKHPLVMATSKAILEHIKKEGPEVQYQLNERTAQFAKNLNAFFEQEEQPVKLASFGSIFRLVWSDNISYQHQPLEMDLLFYHLMEKGIYTWEGRTCFLSTAHTETDMKYVMDMISESVDDLRNGGFLNAYARKKNHSKNPRTPQKNNIKEYRMLLSETQKQLWLLAQMKNKELFTCYSIPIALRLRGSFNPDAISRSIQKLTNRHESLRTTFIDVDSQCIQSVMEIKTPLIDFRHMASNERDKAVRAWFRKESATPFDLTQGPLFRAYILRLEDDLHILSILIHHLIADGLSINIILREFAELYSAECEGSNLQQNAPGKFSEYFKSHTLETGIIEDHISYIKQSVNNIQTLNLPTDKSKPLVKIFQCARESMKLNADLYHKIKKISQKNSCSQFITLLSGYMILVHRLTNQNDIVVGIPCSGRTIPGSETIVGNLQHLLPIRSSIIGDPPFADYLRNIKKVILEAYEHQDYNVAGIVNKMLFYKESKAIFPIQTTFNFLRNQVLTWLESALKPDQTSHSKELTKDEMQKIHYKELCN